MSWFLSPWAYTVSNSTFVGNSSMFSGLPLSNDNQTNFVIRNISECERIRQQQDQEDVLIEQRFPFVVVAGITICLAGISSTVFLINILTRKGMQANTVVYLVFLALFDIAIMVNYILLISVGVMKSYFRSVFLSQIYFWYMKPLFALGRVTQTSQTYLIVAATMERYLIGTRNSPFSIRRVTGKNLGCSPRCRYLTISLVVLLSFVLRWSSYFEIDYRYNDCPGFESISFDMGFIIYDPHYQVYSSIVSPILNTYLPFVLLIWLNIMVLYRMRYTSSRSMPQKGTRALQQARCSEGQSRAILIRQMLDRRVLRDAANTMVAIVTSYLISNVLNVAIAIGEQTRIDWLLSHVEFYTISSDLSSFLVVLTSASRLPIYYWCNSKIKELCDQTCSKRVFRTTGRYAKKSVTSTVMQVTRKQALPDTVEGFQESIRSQKDKLNGTCTVTPISSIFDDNRKTTLQVRQTDMDAIHEVFL